MTDVTLPSGIAIDELDADVRPQDDLFRHVNGKWIDRTEIPRDKARYGSFYVLAEEAEKAVRDIIEEAQQAEPGTEERKVGDLYASFMDEERVEALGADADRRRSSPRSTPSTRSTTLLATLGRLERAGRQRASSSSSSTTTRATPSATSSSSSRAASACPTSRYYREEKFADDPHGVPRAPRAHVRRSPGSTTPPTAPPASSTSRPTIAAHALGQRRARATARRPTTRCTWDGRRRRSRPARRPRRLARRARACPRASFDEVVVRQPSFVDGLGGAAHRRPPRRLADWLRWQVIRSNAAYLLARLRRGELRLLRPHPHRHPEMRARWKRGVSLVEGAMGEAVGRIYVERHFPPDREDGDGRARRQPRRGVPRSRSPTLDWMSDDDPRARAREARASSRRRSATR